MCSLFMATAHRHSSHEYSLPCAQQMDFSNAKTIKSFTATGSKYTINNSENVKESVFLTERFFFCCFVCFLLIKESIVSYPAFLSVHQRRAKETGLGVKGGQFLC